MVGGQAILREFRSKTTPWPFPICLMVGQSLNLESTGWLCVIGNIMSVNTSEIEDQVSCVFFSVLGFWWKLWFLRRAVNNSKLLKPLFWGAVKYCVNVFSHPPYTLAAAPRGYVWWGNSYSLLPFPPSGCRACFRVQSRNVSENQTWLLRVSGLFPDYLWKSHGVAWAVMESPLARGRWNFGLGAGTFLHLMCCSPMSTTAKWRKAWFSGLCFSCACVGRCFGVMVVTVSSALPGPLVF